MLILIPFLNLIFFSAHSLRMSNSLSSFFIILIEKIAMSKYWLWSVFSFAFVLKSFICLCCFRDYVGFYILTLRTGAFITSGKFPAIFLIDSLSTIISLFSSETSSDHMWEFLIWLPCLLTSLWYFCIYWSRFISVNNFFKFILLLTNSIINHIQCFFFLFQWLIYFYKLIFICFPKFA